MKRILFKVNGIRNHTEKVQIKKALEKIEGIGQIAIDSMDSTINVEYNPPATERTIQECIDSTGQEATIEDTDDMK